MIYSANRLNGSLFLGGIMKETRGIVMETRLHVNPFHFVKALSSALELSTNGISAHHLGTAIIANAFGKALKLQPDQQQLLVTSALLHDIGAASDWDEKHRIVYDDHESHIFRHAILGAQILKQAPLFESMSDIVLHHHDRYLGNNPSGAVMESIPLLARILHLADRIDVMIQPQQNILLQRESITRHILQSDYFDPALITVFEQLALKESFWLDVQTLTHEDLFGDTEALFGKVSLDLDDLIAVAVVFASIVDEVSRFTYKHSFNVANVASALAQFTGHSDDEVKVFYLAGLLHDLGKLSVPEAILNKQSALNDEEFLIMKQHPYYSQRILSMVDGLEELANWIGHHHEVDDGFGYPDRILSESFNPGIRILQIADIFCALVEKRPYRAAMSPEAVHRHLTQMVDHGKLDESMTSTLLDRLHLFIQLVDQNVSERA
jgi:putative nucleotidyltransferase with HDIG domain